MLRYSIEIIGWLAAAMMLSAYLLLTMGKLSARSNLYHWFNALSGAGFIINSGWNGAYHRHSSMLCGCALASMEYLDGLSAPPPWAADCQCLNPCVTFA